MNLFWNKDHPITLVNLFVVHCINEYMEILQENITILLHVYVYNVLYHYTIITVAGPHRAAWSKLWASLSYILYHTTIYGLEMSQIAQPAINKMSVRQNINYYLITILLSPQPPPPHYMVNTPNQFYQSEYSLYIYQTGTS